MSFSFGGNSAVRGSSQSHLLPFGSAQESVFQPPQAPFYQATGCGMCFHCGGAMPSHPQWFFCSQRCMAEAAAGSSPMQHQRTISSFSGSFSGSFSAAASSTTTMSSQATPPAAAQTIAPVAAAAAATSTVPPGRCTSCADKAVMAGTPFCSRRCSWFSQVKCPQCGRARSADFAYCSAVCAAQATQANWCPWCGIRQILSGTSACSAPSCVAAARSSGCQPPLSGRKKRAATNSMSHEMLPASDMVRACTVAPFQGPMAEGMVQGVISVIKVNPSAAQRRAYLCYRSSVESVMTQFGMGKYRHGGEGNEHRRYFPLALGCDLGGAADTMKAANSFLPPLCLCNDANTVPASPPRTPSSTARCDVCCVLSTGFNMQTMCRGSHYATSSIKRAISICQPNADGVRAMVVARCVIGNPELIEVSASDTHAPQINTPQDPTTVHSVIVTNGDAVDEGAYLFRDDAVDPLFVVVFQ